MIVSAVLRCEVWQHGASPLGREVRNQWLDGQWHEDMGEAGPVTQDNSGIRSRRRLVKVKTSCHHCRLGCTLGN